LLTGQENRVETWSYENHSITEATIQGGDRFINRNWVGLQGSDVLCYCDVMRTAFRGLPEKM
jgi:hypothetical protein